MYHNQRREYLREMAHAYVTLFTIVNKLSDIFDNFADGGARWRLGYPTGLARGLEQRIQVQLTQLLEKCHGKPSEDATRQAVLKVAREIERQNS